MGLFGLGKKKNILPSSGAEAPQLADETEQIDFDNLVPEMPYSKTDEAAVQNKTDSMQAPEEPGSAKTAPASDAAEKATETQADHNAVGDKAYVEIPLQKENKKTAPQAPDKPGFDLPDFIDEEMREAAQAKPVQKEPEKKPEPPKPVIRREMPHRPVPIPQKPVSNERYMNAEQYLVLKQEFEEIKKLMSASQDTIENDAILSKEEAGKYQDLAESLNGIQERLMIIDSKLFEE